MQVQLERSERDGATIVSVAGELDALAAPALDDFLAAQGAIEQLVLDLGDVTFLDSTGLGHVIKAYRSVTGAGGTFALVATAPRVLKVLTITGVDERIGVWSSVDAALAGDG